MGPPRATALGVRGGEAPCPCLHGVNMYERVTFAVPARRRRAERAGEGAERGNGVRASDRAGVWGRAASPRRAERAGEGAERGNGVPASDRAGVWGRAPRYLR